MKKLIFIFLIIVSCRPDDITGELNPDYIVFGHFHGFCGGETCIEIYKLTGDALYEDSRDTYPAADKPYEGNFHLLDNSVFEKVSKLSATIPSKLLKTPSGIIGNPDATDMGGIYFEISWKGKRSFWLIDKVRHNIPQYMRPFVGEIEAKIELINS